MNSNTILGDSSGEVRLVHTLRQVVFTAKVRHWGVITGNYSLKRSVASPDFLHSCTFHIHFMEHLILKPLSSKGLKK